MDPNEPPEPSRPHAESGGAAYEALRRLEERLDRASDAAERLLADAAARAAADAAARGAAAAGEQPHDVAAGEPAAGRPDDPDRPGAGTPPPSGWQVPGSDARGSASDLELFANLVQSLRDLIPPELQRRLAEAFRELLMALRALIDWYLDRVEQRRREPAEVQDIPIA
jgi:hypothetical protein